MDLPAPVLLVDGAAREPEMYDLGEPWFAVLRRAYEAGITDERNRGGS